MKPRFLYISFIKQLPVWFFFFIVFTVFGPISLAGVSNAPFAANGSENKISNIWGGGQSGNASIVFYLDSPVAFSKPQKNQNEIQFLVKNTSTHLPRFRRFLSFDTWVALENRGRDIFVRVGISDDISTHSVFSAEAPSRLIINLYSKKTIARLRPHAEQSTQPGISSSPADSAGQRKKPTVTSPARSTDTPAASPAVADTPPSGRKIKKKEQKKSPAVQRNPLPPTPAASLEKFVHHWIAAWSSGDMDAYARCYAKNFFSSGMNRRQWVTYKKDIQRKNEHIEIQIGPIQILKDAKNDLQISFLQRYRSTSLRDIGIKTLVLIEENEEWKILSETWVEKKDEIVETNREQIHLHHLQFK